MLLGIGHAKIPRAGDARVQARAQVRASGPGAGCAPRTTADDHGREGYAGFHSPERAASSVVPWTQKWDELMYDLEARVDLAGAISTNDLQGSVTR